MEQVVLTDAPTEASGQNISTEIIGLEVKQVAGCIRAEIFIHEEIESLLSIYSISGQLKFRRKVLNSGHHEFHVDLKKGVYVVILISGKNWTARRVIIN